MRLGETVASRHPSEISQLNILTVKKEGVYIEGGGGPGRDRGRDIKLESGNHGL